MLIVLLTFISIYTHAFSAPQDEISKLKIANSLLDVDPDSSFILYTELIPQFESNKDTVRLIRSHMGISDVYKNRSQFGQAYDHIWDALLLAEEFRDTVLLMEVHEDVGGLYALLEKYQDATKHFKYALKFAKYLNLKGEIREARQVTIYYSLIVIKRKAGYYDMARQYIDTCLMLDAKHDLKLLEKGYLDAEIGCNYMFRSKYDLAEKHLLRSNEHFKQTERSYEIMTSLFLGQFYSKMEAWDAAERYFLRSLSLMNKFKSHSDVKAEALQYLSEAQYELGKYSSAYSNLDRAYSISDSLFSSKSSQNSNLFQIKNKYAETIREKDLHILEQNSIIERNRLIQSRMRTFIASILLLVLIALIMLWYQARMRRVNFEKQQLRQKAKHDLEKANSVTEVKTRELTASTLQLIEKEKFIEELLDELKNASRTSYLKMKGKVKSGNKDMWDEFNLRFTEVNSDFYAKLREKHPDLTPTEQKHCALIKLNFSSKEMANLLNISINSVHISRHRIRKKIALERDDNLSNYIADITR